MDLTTKLDKIKLVLESHKEERCAFRENYHLKIKIAEVLKCGHEICAFCLSQNLRLDFTIICKSCGVLTERPLTDEDIRVQQKARNADLFQFISILKKFERDKELEKKKERKKETEKKKK